MSWTLALAFHEQRTSERAHAILNDSDNCIYPMALGDLVRKKRKSLGVWLPAVMYIWMIIIMKSNDLSGHVPRS
jgi:hypothetical protein